ncbi:hypothetical protein [Bradyrhizobium hipponense]|uniref:hypothetical protein n=1 Tax=Bradyrhizobium hipponense TaxID=2605638 RepID=UPI00165338E4|nr:hypothetical protein [Bradyrhizobium hipponense]
MGFWEAIIIGIALYAGLNSIAEAFDNIAVGIEQAGLHLAAALEEPVAEEDED